jgi:Protein of unknown function (DUF4230)
MATLRPLPALERLRVTARQPSTSKLVTILLVAGVAVLGLLLLLQAGRRLNPVGRLLDSPGTTSVTQAVVVEKMRAVSQLVSSETTVRDVVVYQNRRLGSTKKSLVVVTGRILTGIDLDRGTEVRVDEDDRQIEVVLPRASVLAVDVTQLKTYDERSGLWNPFRPADRDTIYRLAREQLLASAGELEVAAHAEENAKRLLEAMIHPEGYTTEISFRGKPGDELDRK